MREYASADFSHEGKILNRSKKAKKAIYDANNARNRDAFAVTKSNNMLKGETQLNQYDNKSTNHNEVEDTLIAVIDNFNEKIKG